MVGVHVDVDVLLVDMRVGLLMSSGSRIQRHL